MAGAQDQPSTLGGTWGSQDHGDVWVTAVQEGCRGPNTAQLLVLSLPSVLCAELCLFLGGGGMSGRAPAVQVDPQQANRPAGAVGTGGPPNPTAHGTCPHRAGHPGMPGPQQPLFRSGCQVPQAPKAQTPSVCARGPHPSPLPAHFTSSCFVFLNFPSPLLPAASGHSFVRVFSPRGPLAGTQGRQVSTCSLDRAVAGHWAGGHWDKT